MCRGVGGEIVHDIWKRQNVDDEDDEGGDEEVVNCGIPQKGGDQHEDQREEEGYGFHGIAQNKGDFGE